MNYEETAIDNPALRISLGVLIATGKMRKEVSRELFIYLKVYKEQTIQRLHNPLADWIILSSRAYTGRVILKQLAGWWIWESLDRCTVISQFFTETEQEEILTRLLQIEKSPGKIQKSML